MNGAGLARLNRWNDAGQKPQRVLTEMIHGAICGGIEYFKGSCVDEFMRQELRKIDPAFEIVYDRATSSGTLEPAFHLYRRIKGGANSPERLLRLEFSLQENCDLPWPQGKPREPGRWVIDEIRKHDKSNLSSDPEIANRRFLKQMRDKDLEETAKADIQDYEPIAEFEKECQEIIDGKKSMKGRKHNRRSPKDAPVQIAMPQQFNAVERNIVGA